MDVNELKELWEIDKKMLAYIEYLVDEIKDLKKRLDVLEQKQDT